MKITYRDIFFETYGFGPYVCVFCEGDVTVDGLDSHHLDHNHHNAPDNPSPSHSGCHMSHHGKGRPGLCNHVKKCAPGCTDGKHRPRSAELREASRQGQLKQWGKDTV